MSNYYIQLMLAYSAFVHSSDASNAASCPFIGVNVWLNIDSLAINVVNAAKLRTGYVNAK